MAARAAAGAIGISHWIGATVTLAALSASLNCYGAPIKPVPDNPLQAQTSLGFNIKSRCPDLHLADAGTRAVVIFWVPGHGKHSQISLKTSSGLEDLDAAALDCASKLRFAPATTVDDGEPFDSWQQIAFTWADPGKTYEATHAAEATHSAGAAPPKKSAADGNRVTVYVCADETGKLVQDPTIVKSSGSTALDQAAVKIAAAGSAYYHPSTATSAPPSSGCVQMAIEFGTK